MPLLLCFLLMCLLPFALAWDSTKLLFSLVRENDTFSQIPLIPLLSLFLIYENRAAIFAAVSISRILGAALIIPGMVLIAIAKLNVWQLGSINAVSLLMLAAFLVWLGAFGLLFGVRAFRVACFPLFFLLFMVPIPEPALSKIIYFLQAGSSDMVEVFFRMAGIPYLRQGLIFELPGVAIRVAEECSGIRSSLALLITTVLASHFFLRANWKRMLLCAVVVPIVIFKNGLRIATLSILAIYVNPGFLYGRLHHQGGFVFFIIALLPMALALRLLQKSENPSGAAPVNAPVRMSDS
ncbi:MAG: exosortase/archaeosortase family protein [Candidatus Acidiferrales bacterium]